jgi:hypothetical protein
VPPDTFNNIPATKETANLGVECLVRPRKGKPGAALNLVGLDPVRALYWAAVVNGILAPMMLIVRDPRVMRRLAVSPTMAIRGGAAGRRDGRGFAHILHPAVERAAPRHGSEQRRHEPKVASPKAAEVDPARLLAQCRRTAAARLGFSGDIKGLGAP